MPPAPLDAEAGADTQCRDVQSELSATLIVPQPKKGEDSPFGCGFRADHDIGDRCPAPWRLHEQAPVEYIDAAHGCPRFRPDKSRAGVCGQHLEITILEIVVLTIGGPGSVEHDIGRRGHVADDRGCAERALLKRIVAARKP